MRCRHASRGNTGAVSENQRSNSIPDGVLLLSYLAAAGQNDCAALAHPMTHDKFYGLRKEHVLTN